MPAKSGADAIVPCTGTCGGYVYPKRMTEATAKAHAAARFTEPVRLRATTSRNICASCRHKQNPYPSTVKVKDAAELAVEQAQKERIAAERLEAARKARETIEAQRAARARARVVRRVGLGQDMVRI